jgi:hypothetical protein
MEEIVTFPCLDSLDIQSSCATMDYPIRTVMVNLPAGHGGMQEPRMRQGRTTASCR